MATQHCPRCKSYRIRHGYRSTPFFRKLIFRYNLLCNDCNWEFVGFAIPGTIPSKTRRKKKLDEFNEPPKFETNPKLDNKQPEKIDNFEKVQLETLEVTEPTTLETLENNEMVEAQEIEISQTNKKKTKVRKRVRVKFT